MQTLLKSDETQSMTIPVFSNFHLLDEINKLKNDQYVSKWVVTLQVRSMIFLNCGGLIDLTQQWFYNRENNVTAFIFDSHRPYNHNNLIDELNKVPSPTHYMQICVINDGCKSFEEFPNAEDARIFAELQDEMEDDEEYDSEDESENEEVKDELRELKDSEDEEEDVYGGAKAEKREDEEDLDGIHVGTKRPREQTIQD